MKTYLKDATKIQGALAIASFSIGTLIALGCIFILDPKGEITNSAISIVSEFLILAGALLGVKTSFDTRLAKFEGEMNERLKRDEDELHQKV